AGRQTGHGMQPPRWAPASARAHPPPPVQIVTAVRTAIRPPPAKRAKHALLLADQQSHVYGPPSSFRREHCLSPQVAPRTRSVGRIGQPSPPMWAGTSQQIVRRLQNGSSMTHPVTHPLSLLTGPRFLL